MMDSIANRRTADAAFGPGCASPDCRAGRRGMDVTPASHGFWILGNICALAMGLTAIARSPALALGIMMPLLFVDSQGLGNVPGLKKVIDYLPDQAGAVIVHLNGPPGGRFSRPYGPWTGMVTMLTWVVAALGCGYLVLAHTDVTSISRPRLRRQTPE